MLNPGTTPTTVMRKVSWRIIPLCFALYVVSYIDRSNIGYAALEMNKDLALSGGAFGFAAGIFFFGYFLFEVPSNIAMRRFGARVWICRILISWGIVAALTAFVTNAWQLYSLRFLLGVAEAGFFPGIILYLTDWFPARNQATTIALFTAAIPTSYIIAAPLSTIIMDHVHALGLAGWRWMLLLEAAPAILGGIAAYLWLTDRPEDADWLDQDERDWLVEQLAHDQTAVKGARHLSTLAAITTPKVLYLAIIYFIYQCGSLGVGYWLPLILKSLSSHATNSEIGLIAILPYAAAATGMVAWSRHSDRRGERRYHTAFPLLAAALALGAAGVATGAALPVILISIALTGLYAFKSPFWSLPGLFLTRSSAAVSIAAINSIGNLGGFAGPYAIGVLKDHTQNPLAGLLVLAGLVFVAFLMTLAARLSPDTARAAP